MAKHRVHKHRHVKPAKVPWHEKDPSAVPPASQLALRQAMVLEDVALTDYDDLLWIMAQESEGVVDVRNPKSSARGLYQLLEPQYDLNPHGIKSFGNATEEAQGGIRYILGRYHTVAAARAFWEKHHWY